MKIEVGKYYKTVCGEKAYVACLEPFEPTTQWPFFGYIEGKYPECFRWKADGDSSKKSYYDIASEWKDPVQHEVIVSIYHIA